jgi:hypothetical protein
MKADGSKLAGIDSTPPHPLSISGLASFYPTIKRVRYSNFAWKKSYFG